MATCKDCIHKFVCSILENKGYPQDCKHFADSSRFVELPCKVGDKVYVIENDEIVEDYVDQIGIGYYCDGENIYQMDGIKTDWYFSDFGETVFLTREEAEQALKERV